MPNPGNPQDLNRYTYARNNPMLYTDLSGHFGIIEGIIFGVVIGTVASGIQSDWDLEATIVGGVIGGVTGGVGAGIGSSVFHATVDALGQTWAGVAGGVVGGAAAGGTSGVLASAAGYKVNIGLAIASGAAAGGIVGGAYGQWGQGGAFLAAPAAGASAAAIRGADPGVGTLIAAGTAAFSLGLEIARNWDMIIANGRAAGFNMAAPGIVRPTTFDVIPPDTLILRGETVGSLNNTSLGGTVERFFLNSDNNSAGNNSPDFHEVNALGGVVKGDGIFGTVEFTVDLTKVGAKYGYLRLTPESLAPGFSRPTITVFDGAGGVIPCSKCAVYPTLNYTK